MFQTYPKFDLIMMSKRFEDLFHHKMSINQNNLLFFTKTENVANFSDIEGNLRIDQIQL